MNFTSKFLHRSVSRWKHIFATGFYIFYLLQITYVEYSYTDYFILTVCVSTLHLDSLNTSAQFKNA